MNIADNFRVPLNLNGRQLLSLSRHRRLAFALSEKIFGIAEKARHLPPSASCLPTSAPL